VQDEKHKLLDCPSADFAELRIKHYPLATEAGIETLLAKQTPKAWPCSRLSAWNAVRNYQDTTLLAFCWFWLQACLASAKLPSFGRYSSVT